MQEYDLIEAPENVELQRRLAGIDSRFIAGLTDNLLIASIYFVLFIAMLISGINIFEGDGISGNS